MTRDAYALDLRQFATWCQNHNLRLFEVRRADIECYARHLEELGRARATVARPLSTMAGFYCYAEHALVSLLAINGLRVSGALGADVDASASSVATAP